MSAHDNLGPRQLKRGGANASSRAPGRKADDTLSQSSLANDVYVRLRAEIVGANYQSEERLRFRQLQAAYGVSVGTLREALVRLAENRLVTMDAQRGFRVAAMSRSDLLDIIATRKLVEGLALERSISVGDDVWEADLVSAHHRLSRVETRLKRDGSSELAAEWEHLHREFHRALVGACRSVWLLHFCEMLRDQCDRYRRMACAPPAHYPTISRLHAALVAAALARDAKQARSLLDRHFDETARIVIKAQGGGSRH